MGVTAFRTDGNRRASQADAAQRVFQMSADHLWVAHDRAAEDPNDCMAALELGVSLGEDDHLLSVCFQEAVVYLHTDC